MKKTGFTLIELMVVIAIIGILAAVVVPQFSGGAGKKAEVEMAEYVGTHYGKPDANISCKNSDTDGDGNVRCTASWDENGTTKLISAECSYRAGGCSEAIKQVVQN